jgi:hypothetical protein
MSNVTPTEGGGGSPSLGGRVEAMCDRFEAAWKAGRRPPIQDDLRVVPEPERAVLLRALLELELAYRRQNGERPTPEEYRCRFSEHAAVIDTVFGAAFPPRAERSRAGDDSDETLTYSVGRDGGRVARWIDADQQQRLRDAFTPTETLQGRYRIDRELGRGGMGVVFLGRDLRLDRPVAVKVSLLLGRASDPEETGLAALRDAFAEEARLGANLTHPAIATVYDYGFHNDKPFTVFEYLPGETLGDLLRRRGRLPLEEVKLVVGPLAQALDYAHARRVVHRDLKPDNIRATEQGLFKVLDLGLAREFGRDVDWSGFAGTPAYASPEQASGLACDGRADQYALALIVFELLTGRRIFRSSDPHDLLAKHREAEPAALETDLDYTPEAVRLALARALSKDPNERFAACGDFAVALGCQLLSAPAPTPEILLEADIERLTVGRLAWWVSLLGLRNAVHLALTREAVWSADHTEVRRWPLAGIERVEPQADPVGEREAAELAEGEVVRQLHLDAEANIRFIGLLHFIVLVPVLLILAVVVGVAMFGVPRPRIGPTLVLVGVLTPMCCWLFNVGRGLRKLRPWAFRAALAESLVVLALEAGLLVAMAVVPRTDSFGFLPPLFWFLSPGLALVAYMAWILLSRKASVVFAPSYREFVDRISYLGPRRALGFGITGRPAHRTLRLTLRVPDGHPSRVAFRFANAGECEHWAGRLAVLAKRYADLAAPGGEATPAELAPVVLLRERSTAKYHFLGPVEAKANNRRTAEAGLMVRAAMMGADAVVDLQEEFLPDFRRTVRRLTGTAVRAVDAESRFEFRTRWYDYLVARVSTWAIELHSVNLAIGIYYYVYPLPRLDMGVMTATAGVAVDSPPGALAWDLLRQFLESGLVAGALLTWPVGLAVLVRGLRWPQLVRPLALTLVASALSMVYLLIGLVAAALLSGGWAGPASSASWLLNPMALLFAVFNLFLGRSAWRADREFRLAVRDTGRKALLRRSLGGRLALAASVAYAALLACYLIGFGYLIATQFRNGV